MPAGVDRFVSFVARLITRGLFRSVEVIGFDDLPAGPRLIVANHFNGFVDPVGRRRGRQRRHLRFGRRRTAPWPRRRHLP